MKKSILSTDIKIIPFPIYGSEDQKYKRNIEINILLDWLKTFVPNSSLNYFYNKKLNISSLKIRFKNSNLEEIDFIFYLKSPEKITFILIEVEKSWFSSNKEIKDSINFKNRKLEYFIDLINFKNQSINESFEIKEVVIIKKGDKFFVNENGQKVFENLNTNNFIWEPEIIRSKLLSLYNKSVPINWSANNIFMNDYEVYDVVKEKLSHLMVDLLKNESTPQAIKINGNPGSGKTLIALLLYKELIDNGKNVGLYFLTQNTIKDFFWNETTKKYQENILFGEFESQDFNWKKFTEFDYIIVDEQQRLFKNQSVKFFNNLKQNCKVILIGDDNQKIKPSEMGFKIPRNISSLSIFLDSTFLRYSKSHLNFLSDLILKGKLLQKVYHSEIKFEFVISDGSKEQISNYSANLDENLLVKNFEPYIQRTYSDNESEIEPSTFMGEECDVVIFDLSPLEVESKTRTTIMFKSRFTKSYRSKNELEIDDTLTKQGIYCGLTRATQKIVIIGTKEMSVYFKYAFSLLNKVNK
ncbi:MAG: AAA family ATPase [Metamycoplasmataceae bacterium]